MPYDEDDKEADDIYKYVDDRMGERRRDRKIDLDQKRVEEMDKEHMDLNRQFEDLKVRLIIFLRLREVKIRYNKSSALFSPPDVRRRSGWCAMRVGPALRCASP